MGDTILVSERSKFIFGDSTKKDNNNTFGPLSSEHSELHIAADRNTSASASVGGSGSSSNLTTTTTTTNETSPTSLPWHILQYGPPRTATTYQFELLCLCAFVKIFDEGEKRDNFAAVEKLTCRFMGQFQDVLPSVVKTHVINSYPPKEENNKDVWLFTTSNGDANATFHRFTSRGYNVKYVQEVQSLGKLGGHYMAYNYQGIFDLTDEQMEQIVEFMRYWEILRKCCGMQMSDDWREQLLPLKKKKPGYTAHHNEHDPVYPACQMYDIDAVETLFLHTKLAQAMSVFPNMHTMLRPSTVDGTLNGKYCSRYNAAVEEHGIGMNERIPVIDGPHAEGKAPDKSRRRTCITTP